MCPALYTRFWILDLLSERHRISVLQFCCFQTRGRGEKDTTGKATADWDMCYGRRQFHFLNPKKNKYPLVVYFSIPRSPDLVSAVSLPKGGLNKPKGTVDDEMYLLVIDRATKTQFAYRSRIGQWLSIFLPWSLAICRCLEWPRGCFSLQILGPFIKNMRQ